MKPYYTDDYYVDGQEKEALIFSFTNGAKEQLLKLKEFFKQENELELLMLAISLLQKVKEQQEVEDKSKSKSPTYNK